MTDDIVSPDDIVSTRNPRQPLTRRTEQGSHPPMPARPSKPTKPRSPKERPFRRAVLRGVAVVLPPLLTVVILLWVWSTVQAFVLGPVEHGAEAVLYYSLADIRTPAEIREVEIDSNPDYTRVETEDGVYVRIGARYIPLEVNDYLYGEHGVWPGSSPQPTAQLVYEQYVRTRYLKPYVVVPIFLVVFILLMYMLGKFLAAGVGRVTWGLVERGVSRLPLVSNVYSSVKQVTDFMFTESEIQYTRVVAIEYPRKGIWSIALVTSESLLEIRSAANEPVLAVLVPSSPMPITGYTMTVKKSEAIDLDLSIDQALQFVVSCGVVVPPHQLPQPLGNGEMSDKPLAVGVESGVIPAGEG
jgi:uncharacterized membrane protein